MKGQLQQGLLEQVFGNMRNFEEYFDFDFRKGVMINRTRDFRSGDSYRTITLGQKEFGGPEREARILAHQKRVQKEMSKLGIK